MGICAASFGSRLRQLCICTYLHALSSVSPERIDSAVDFLNTRQPSLRLTPAVASLYNDLMQHAMVGKPWEAENPVSHGTWLREGNTGVVCRDGVWTPLAPPVRPRENVLADVPQIVLLQDKTLMDEFAHACSRHREAHGSVYCVGSAFTSALHALASAEHAGELLSLSESRPAAVANCLQVGILGAYRAQCALNLMGVEHLLSFVPSERRQELLEHCRIHAKTSFGSQSLTFDEAVLSIPLQVSWVTKFHLEPCRLLNLCGRAYHTLRVTSWTGSLREASVKAQPGMDAVLSLLQRHFSPKSPHVVTVTAVELACSILGTPDTVIAEDWLLRTTRSWLEKVLKPSFAQQHLVSFVQRSTDVDMSGVDAAGVVQVAPAAIPETGDVVEKQPKNFFETLLRDVVPEMSEQQVAVVRSESCKLTVLGQWLVRSLLPTELEATRSALLATFASTCRSASEVLDLAKPVYSSESQDYFYACIPDLRSPHGSREAKTAMRTMDLLAYQMLVQMSTDTALLAGVQESLSLQTPPRLIVGWCTHKYNVSLHGVEVDRLGSGGRTAFFLLLAPDGYEDGVHAARGVKRQRVSLGEWQKRQDPLVRGLTVATVCKLYHTTMWWKGTFLDSGEYSSSSRLLCQYNGTLRAVLRQSAREAWFALACDAHVSLCFGAAQMMTRNQQQPEVSAHDTLLPWTWPRWNASPEVIRKVKEIRIMCDDAYPLGATAVQKREMLQALRFKYDPDRNLHDAHACSVFHFLGAVKDANGMSLI